jgi:cytochrome c oxidase assembly factor CtaG
MAASIGLSYMLVGPLPCYFDSVNRVRWLHSLRDLLFIVLALLLFAVATGFVPLSVLGM